MTWKEGQQVTVIDARGVEGPGEVIEVFNDRVRLRVDFDAHLLSALPLSPGDEWNFWFNDPISNFGLTIFDKPDVARSDIDAAALDAINGGTGVLRDGKRIDPTAIYLDTKDAETLRYAELGRAYEANHLGWFAEVGSHLFQPPGDMIEEQVRAESAAEIARLREAMQPFAREFDRIVGDKNYMDGTVLRPTLTVGELRAARQALTTKPADTPETSKGEG